MRRLLARPHEIQIVGAEAYWLGDVHGRPVGPPSNRTVAPFEQTLRAFALGAEANELVVWASLSDGSLYKVGSGLLLVSMARGSAGIPADIERSEIVPSLPRADTAPTTATARCPGCKP